MYRFIFSNPLRRIIFPVLAGLAGAVLLELTFRLQYRNYIMFISWMTYLGAIGFTALFTEIIRLTGLMLDKRTRWDRRPVFRFYAQLTSHLLIALLIFSGLRLIITAVTGLKPFILLTDEFTIAFLVLALVLALNIVDFGVVLLEQWRYSLAQAEKYKKESAEFEFEMLQAQINPHFLFNSLNTLSSLVYEDAGRSAEFIRKLSDVYRHVLDSRHKDLISIADELAFTRSYVYLLMIRFDKKLEVEIALNERIMNRQIAPLTLQLLIENAVKHNIVSEKRPLHIHVYNDEVYIIVTNKLQPKATEERGSGMGLRNISRRYQAICSKEVKIITENNHFTVKVPIV